MDKNDEIVVKEANIEDVVLISKNILEFTDGIELDKKYFEERYEGKNNVIIVAYINDNPIGYIVGYDKFEDGKSFYIWMAGVDYKFRRQGALTKLMKYQTDWAKSHGYCKLKIKTRNARREMLSYLVKNGFNFTEVEEKENIIENRINLEKQI